MKINWGTSIVLAFTVFIAFILFFVIRMSVDHRADHDLVTEEYYRHELAYQHEIDAEKNAKNGKQLSIEKTEEGLLIAFPKEIHPQEIKGRVSLYRPSDKHLDFDLDLRLSNNYLLIPDNRLLGGRWDIKVFWSFECQDYLQKEYIVY